ncbi:MAG: glycosyltransferase family 39 protein [Dongiaceae bacterium]
MSRTGRLAQAIDRPFDAILFGLPPALWVFLLVQAIAWIVPPMLLNRAPELQTAEIAMWGRDWFWVNDRHPALSSWVLETAYALFGVHIWVTYFVSQLFTCATSIFVFLLGRDLLGTSRSLTGTMLLAGISFFTISTLKFNHDIAQMPFWAAFCFALWRASQSNRAIWWCVTALAAALALYAKFSSLLLIAAGCAWILYDARTRSHLRKAALYIGLVLFCLLLVPLARQSAQLDFMPFETMEQVSAEKGVSTLAFLLGMVEVVFGLAALAYLGGFIARLPGEPKAGEPKAGEPTPAAVEERAPDRRQLAYLLLLGVGPLAVTIALSCFVRLRTEWTAPMFNLIGLLLIAWRVPTPIPAGRIRHLAELAVILSLTTVAAYGGWSLYSRYNIAEPTRVAWPMADISRRFDAIWIGKTGEPLRIVGGDHWAAALAGLPNPAAPSLFTNMDRQLAPAVTPERVAQDGVLVVWRVDGGWQPPKTVLAGHVTGIEVFDWSPSSDSRPIEIGYAIIPPRALTARR